MVDWKEIGKGDHPAQNPPELSDDDQFALDWYMDNTTAYAKEYGLIGRQLDKLNLDEISEDLFLKKISLIHSTFLKIHEKEAEKKEDLDG